MCVNVCVCVNVNVNVDVEGCYWKGTVAAERIERKQRQKRERR